jgi:hypothetical protein
VRVEGTVGARGALLSGFGSLARGADSPGDDLGKSFAEGNDVDRRGFRTVHKRESQFIPLLLVVGRAIFVIVCLTHGTKPCEVALDNVRQLLSLRRSFSAMRIKQTYGLKTCTV